MLLLRHIRALLLVLVMTAYFLFRVVWSKEVEQAIGTAYEVRVIRVDMGVLNLDERSDHLGGGRETLVEHLLHHVTYLALQPVVVVQLGNVYVDYQLSQLLVDFMGTVQGWLEQSGYLLPYEHFEGSLWNE